MKKKIFVCFGEELGSNARFDSFSRQLAQDGFEVHLFDNLIDKDFQPYDVLSTLENMWQDDWQNNDYYFLTDIREFFVLTYRVYQQSFCQFVFLSGYKKPYDVEENTIYHALLSRAVAKEEDLYKPVFTDDLDMNFELDSLNEKKVALDEFTAGKKLEKVQKIYRFDGQCYLLEPTFGNVLYIHLDDTLIEDNFKFTDIIMPLQLDYDILKQAEESLELISNDMMTCLRRVDFFQRLFSRLRDKILVASSLEKCYYSSTLSAISDGLGIYSKIYVNHFLITVFGEYKYYEKFVQECIDSKELFMPHAYYAFMQANALEIKDETDFCGEKLELQTKLFAKICQQYKENIDASLIEFDKTQTDENAVIVMINQFLNASHKQSLYALELCKYLIEKHNKKVVMFNTCEFLSQNQRVPIFNPLSGTIVGEYTKAANIEFENTKIAYYQMLTPMPDAGGIDGILEFFADIKPKTIINLSAFSVAAEVCANFIDTFFVSIGKKDYPVILGGSLITDAIVEGEVKDGYTKAGVKVIEFDAQTANQESSQDLFDELWQKIIN